MEIYDYDYAFEPAFNAYGLRAAGIIGTFVIFTLLFSVLTYILYGVAYAKVFNKADEKGYKAFVPFLNEYTLFRISWSVNWFWRMMLLCALSLVLNICSNALGMAGGTGYGAEILRYIFIFLQFGCVVGACCIRIAAIYKLCKSFGKDCGFFLGMLFLGVIFPLILGFSKTRYIGMGGTPRASYDPSV